jgi:beta-lactamase class A
MLTSLVVVLSLLSGYSFYLIKQHNIPLCVMRERTLDEKLNIIRLNETGFLYTRPLLLVDQKSPSQTFSDIKDKLSDLIEDRIEKGDAEDVSVYFRSLNDGRWFAINEDHLFNPASMLKMSIMICFLKKVEKNPELLKEKIYVKGVNFSLRDPRNAGHYLEPHQYYRYEDLLIKMICGFDNESANLLIEKITKAEFGHFYAELGIHNDHMDELDYQLNVTDFSKFLRILFNSTYLSPEYSEYALKLLSNTYYNNGINRYFNNQLTVAHKFGERILPEHCQVHDSGILYIKNTPVLLTVMSKGKHQANLEQLLADIGKLVKEDVEAHQSVYN